MHIEEDVIRIVREVMREEGTFTQWEIHALAARLRDAFHTKFSVIMNTLRARRGTRPSFCFHGGLLVGPLSGRWLFNTGTVARLLPRMLAKYPGVFSISYQGDDDDVFIELC